MNEAWAAEVERRLRAMNDLMTRIGQSDIRQQGLVNFGLPTVQPPASETDEEIAWIRLTNKTTIGGVNLYEWRRQVYVMTGGGMSWVDSGESGTFAENPAIGLNNENRSTTDGKRYPAKYNPDTSQWIFFLREEETSTGKFIARCRLRQIGGYHYPSGVPTLTEYTSSTTPDRLKLYSRFASTYVQVDNYDVSNFTFGWTEMQKEHEGIDDDGAAYAVYRLFDGNGEISHVTITAMVNGVYDSIIVRKIVRQVEGATVNYTFTVKANDLVLSSENTLRNGTSGTRTTGYPASSYGSYWYISYKTPSGEWIGGNSNFEICWGDGCIPPVIPPPITTQSDFQSTASPASIRLPSYILSNTIRPVTFTSTATVQFAPTETNPVQSLTEFTSSANAVMPVFPTAQVSQTTFSVSATAIATSSDPPTIQVAASATSQATANTILRPASVTAELTATGTAMPVVVAVPAPVPLVSTVTSECAIVVVSTGPPATSTTNATTTVLPAIVVIPPSVSIVWTVSSEASPVVVLLPGVTMPEPTIAVSAVPVVIRTPAGTQSVTATATAEATVDEIGITPKP